MRVWLMILAVVILFGAGFGFSATAKAVPIDLTSGYETGTSAAVQDYRAVRKVTMALAVLGILVALTRLSTSEIPHERNRAETLLMLTLVTFVLLAGDRMLARGVAGWFNFPVSALPVFWQ